MDRLAIDDMYAGAKLRSTCRVRAEDELVAESAISQGESSTVGGHSAAQELGATTPTNHYDILLAAHLADTACRAQSPVSDANPVFLDLVDEKTMRPGKIDRTTKFLASGKLDSRTKANVKVPLTHV